MMMMIHEYVLYTHNLGINFFLLLLFCSPVGEGQQITLTGFDNKPHLMVRLQSWIFGECTAPFYWHYYQVHSDTERRVHVKVSSMGEIEIFDDFLYLKPWILTKSCMGTIQECYELSSTNPRSNIQRNNNCTATYLPSQKHIS